MTSPIWNNAWSCLLIFPPQNAKRLDLYPKVQLILKLYHIKQFLSNHDHENCEVKLAKFKGKTGMIGAASLVNR